jgi:outer membrane lipoprotein-sorting protein
VRTIGLVALAVAVTSSAIAAGGAGVGVSAADDGERIFAEVSRRDRGYGDQQASVSMQLKRKSGSAATRLMDIAILEVPNEGIRTVVTFNSPLDVKGTKVLTYSRESSDDEQWIYLPAFKRVKQISDANKATSFMGSEFTYEDINSLNVQLQEFSYHFVKSEALDGTPCAVVERVPRYSRSGYKRQLAWIDQTRFIVLKVEYYDPKDALLKTVALGRFQQYLDAFWRAGEMVMTNHQSGDATSLSWRDYRFRTGLAANDFSTAALKR